MTPRPVGTARMALSRAADIIEQRGLAKGRRFGKEGAVCVGEALRIAIWDPGPPGQSPFTGMDLLDIYRAAARLLMAQLPHPFRNEKGANPHPLADWNDQWCQTADNVVATLRLVAGKDSQ